MSEPVRVRRDGRLVEVVLDRPPVNALDAGAYARLRAAFEDAQVGEVVLLLGEGRAFCAGQDVHELSADTPPDQVRRIVEQGAATVAAALRCAAPVVVGVHAAAIGAGALLACAADVVVLADDAALALPELGIGHLMGHSVASRLLPAALVRRMLLTGERVTAAELGGDLGARVVSAEQVREVATALARELLDLPGDLVSRARGTWGAGEREASARAYEAEVRASV